MKMLILCLIMSICLSIYAPQERENNQQALSGAYSYNELNEPQHVSECGDDQTQIDLFLFVGYMLNKADQAGITQLLMLKKEVDAFFNSLPEEYTNCLYDDPEFIEICNLYGLTPDDTIDQITDKIVSYASKHFIATKKEIHQGNILWNTEQNYYDAGYLIASFTKKALVTNSNLQQ